MVRNLSFLFAAFTAVPVLALAQAPTAAVPPSANPISRSQAKMYSLLSNVVIAGAEKMPEENYSFKPSPDVRNFGQLVGHLADSQYFFCSSVSGDKNGGPAAEKSKTSKAELIAALKDGVAYCNKTYATMTDANGSEMMKLMNIDFTKLTVLSANTAHCYEHYGNMVTYMRMKGIVPPSSEKEASSGQK